MTKIVIKKKIESFNKIISVDSDKSLSSLEAIIAPLNPINNVRCDTSVWDAGILVNPEKIGLNISLIRRSEKGKATNKTKIMLAA